MVMLMTSKFTSVLNWMPLSHCSLCLTVYNHLSMLKETADYVKDSLNQNVVILHFESCMPLDGLTDIFGPLASYCPPTVRNHEAFLDSIPKLEKDVPHQFLSVIWNFNSIHFYSYKSRQFTPKESQPQLKT